MMVCCSAPLPPPPPPQDRPGGVSGPQSAAGEDLVPEQKDEVEENGECDFSYLTRYKYFDK